MSQFAAQIGTTRQNIHAVINGRTRSKKYRRALALFLDLPVEAIWPEAHPAGQDPGAHQHTQK